MQKTPPIHILHTIILIWKPIIIEIYDVTHRQDVFLEYQHENYIKELFSIVGKNITILQ